MRLITALAVALAMAAALATGAQASNVRPNGEVIATCHSITFKFFGFPNANNNTVKEKVFVHEVLVDEQSFSFNGTAGENTIPITVPPGGGKVDGFATWNTNGFKGSYDVLAQLNCSAPNFTIEKLQEIEGSGEGFTKEPLIAPVGKTIDYEIKITNTGNTELTFSAFTDTKCSGLTGGPTGPLAPGESATYLCSHTLTKADLEHNREIYENVATVTGTPPKGQGSGKKKPSNKVIVHYPKSNERPNGEVKTGCTSITFVYKKFPNAPNNTVTERVYIKGELILTKTFTFNGPEGTDVVHITVPPGNYSVDGFATWNTNGFKGQYDVVQSVKCNATPAFTIEKTQKIEGSAEPFTTSPITGAVGQTIDYQITVANTGNTSLAFSGFTDAHCTGVAGGPAGELPYEMSATYTCSHTIGLADAGKDYENSATVTGTPPAGQGSASTQTSNTVTTHVPVVPAPAFSITKAERVAGSAESFGPGPVEAKRNEVVDYSITVENTGNTPLTFSSFADPVCDEGTLAGGPASEPVAPQEHFGYTCSHLVTPADEAQGSFVNVARITGTPPAFDGSAKTEESNAVSTLVPFEPEPSFSVLKLQRTGGAGPFGNPYTSEEIRVENGQLIEYEIVVSNNGNVPLTLSIADAKCGDGIISGGPAEGEQLAPGHSTSYMCSLGVAGAPEGELIENVARVTGTPPVGDGSEVTKESNTVVAEVT